MANDSQGWVFSSFLFPGDHRADSNALREEEWADYQKGDLKDGFKAVEIKMYEEDSIPMVECMIEDFRGRKVHQKNVFGYIISGDLGLDFHVSKIGYTPEDQKFFDALVNGIKLIENYVPDSKTEFGYGSIFHLKNNWSRAALHYEKALDGEKNKRSLSPTELKVLIDNLGMSYGISGDLSNAERVFDYEVQQDATYPMFHCNLACLFAEKDDLDKALKQLKIAFQYRSNCLPGEEAMPDPSKDDSFKHYWEDPRFQSLAQSVCPTSTNSSRGWVCK